MKKKIAAFSGIIVLILLYCGVGYTDIPYQGIIKLVLILLMAVLLSFFVKIKR